MISKNNKRGANRRVIQNKSPNPPMFQQEPIQKRKFRFKAFQGSGFNNTIYESDLLDLACMATGSTSAYRRYESVKLDKVEVWCANGNGALSNDINLEWLNTNFIGGSGGTVSDTALGTANIAHISSKPPKNSKADFWLSGSIVSEPVFNLECPQGSIVDITVRYVDRDSESARLVTGSVSGAVVGTNYLRYLDSSGAKLLEPVNGNVI